MSYELDKIDARLAQLPATPITDADLDERARLMARRIELDQADRAAPRKNTKPGGCVTISIPDNIGITHIYHAGFEFRAHDLAGRRVIDIPPVLFRSFLTGPNGGDWERANQDNRPLWDRMTRSGAFAD